MDLRLPQLMTLTHRLPNLPCTLKHHHPSTPSNLLHITPSNLLRLTPSNLLHLTPSNLQLTNLTRSSQCPTNKSSPTMATLPTSRPATEHIRATLPRLLAMDHHRVTHRRLPAMEHHPATLHSLPAMEHHPATLHRLIAMVLPLPTLPSLLATPLQHQATATIHGVAVTTQPSRPMDPI